MSTYRQKSLFTCTRIRMLALLPFLVGGLAVAWARGPDLPVKIVKPDKLDATGLNVIVSVDPAVVVEIVGSSTVESQGVVISRDAIAQRHFPAPVAEVATEEYAAVPQVAAAQLPEGVYARTIDVHARLQGGDNKLLVVSDIQYFKVERGEVEIISSKEYTDAVEPASPAKDVGGKVRLHRPGAGRDMGIVRQSGNTPMEFQVEDGPPNGPQDIPGTPSGRHR